MRCHVSSWIVALVATVAAACQEGEEPLVSGSSAEVVGTNILMTGERLLPTQSISSGSTVLVYQNDNNLVLYQNGWPIWSSATDHGIPSRFEMQTDCNAVVYPIFGKLWSSRTAGRGSSCHAKVIEGDWFICSGTTRVFSARGGGSCGGQGTYVCREPSEVVPLPGLEYFRVRIESSSLYVCDTFLGWEGHIPWPQLSQAEINDQCVGACGAGCSPNTCSRQGVGGYVYMGGTLACRDTQYDCYSTDCCWYHDLCGRMFPTSLFTNPFCHALGIAYNCGLCAGNGFVGCGGLGYTRTFRHSYTYREDCITVPCVDRPGDCFDDCSGTCWFGCDVDLDCRDDCYGDFICGTPCSLDESGPGLKVRVGEYSIFWAFEELDALAVPLGSLTALTGEEETTLGLSRGVSVRALLHGELSEGARPTNVEGEHGISIDVDAGAWNDMRRTPVLLVEADGQLRFQWFGSAKESPSLGGVQTIDVELEPGSTLGRIMKCP